MKTACLLACGLVAASVIIQPLPARSAETYPASCQAGSAMYVAAVGKSGTRFPNKYDTDKLTKAEHEFLTCATGDGDVEDALYGIHGLMLVKIARGRINEMDARVVNVLTTSVADRKSFFTQERASALANYQRAFSLAQNGMEHASQGRSDWSIFLQETFWLVDAIKYVSALDFARMPNHAELLQMRSTFRVRPPAENVGLHDLAKPPASSTTDPMTLEERKKPPATP